MNYKPSNSLHFKILNVTRNLVYYPLIAILITLILLKVEVFSFDKTNADSARYLLSTFIQSQATIFALVVTLSLVVIQQASSSYSPRLVNDFLKSPDFWLLSIIYITTIIYETWILKEITPELKKLPQPVIFSSSVEFHIWFAYACFAFSLISLLPYIYNTINLLMPSEVINRIINKINYDSLVNFYNLNVEESASFSTNGSFSTNSRKHILSAEKNPFQPMFDIIKNSLSHNDYETAAYGIHMIGFKIKSFEENETFSQLNDRQRLSFLVKLNESFESLAQFTSNKTEGICLEHIVNSFDKVLILIAHEDPAFTPFFIGNFISFSELAAKNKNRRAIEASIKVLKSYKNVESIINDKILYQYIDVMIKSIEIIAENNNLGDTIKAMEKIEKIMSDKVSDSPTNAN